MRATLRAAATLAAVATLIALVGATGAVAQDRPQERVNVDLQADGDAIVTTVYTYDLEDDAQQQSFANLEDERENLSTRYEARLWGVAESVSNETGREMAIQDVEATFDRRDGVGVVRLSATWTNLAAIDGDELVLSAPFDDGFDSGRPLVVRAPEGEEIVDTSVTPTEQADGQATWSAEADLSGFEVTMTTSGGGGDGQLAPSAVLPGIALLVAGGLLAVRRRSAR
ncbi:hypothetical protein L593_01775 [Salinarchaeum sp. Harcht-Bsk1]|uniref:DUF4897 domain-containing protein n=1 Tax=Salinarchaeum sp. Harcht-Bsk1 TaxID=1333523 RepID=UPI00034232C6|nr:DUF4897 domain-containing protein [Salinarchaeum sp. Harcht-Bsk1]AGN00306.1 hypothetical protein L593_01775 [Salinarchaeum sp. Harcht-Bsk1]